jgi:hypothetical protein
MGLFYERNLSYFALKIDFSVLCNIFIKGGLKDPFSSLDRIVKIGCGSPAADKKALVCEKCAPKTEEVI